MQSERSLQEKDRRHSSHGCPLEIRRVTAGQRLPLLLVRKPP